MPGGELPNSGCLPRSPQHPPAQASRQDPVLDLRGRRVRRAVILISDGDTPTPPGVGKLGMEVVPAEYAASAVLAALRGER